LSGIPDAWGTPLFALFTEACRRSAEYYEAYERGGRPADLDRAAYGFTEILAMARNVDVRSAAANGLGLALWSRYERSGDLADLDAAVDLFRDALAMYGDEQTPSTPAFHANLAGVLRLRWRRTRSEDDLAKSLTEIRTAVAMTRPSDGRRSQRLNHLADGLLSVSLHHDDSSALTEAIDLFRQAVACAGPADDLAAMRSNLAEALRLRYHSFGGTSVLDEAVEQSRAALVPDHPLRARFQANLALVLIDRYTARRRPADLVEAAKLAEVGVAATPAGHPNRAERLLALARIRRMEMSHGSDRPGRRAVRRMVKAAREAAAAVPEGHQLHADALVNEGSALVVQADSGDRTAFDAAIAVFRRAAKDPTAPVRARVSAARQWAMTEIIRTGGQDPRRAREGYDLAVSLLPLAAHRRVTHADRERQLAAFTGVARDAAAVAIWTGDPRGALRLLEHGRGVLLGQALDSRAELTTLRARRPDLAERFEAVRTALDASEDTGFSSAGEDRHASAGEWDRLLDEIRAVHGFASFLEPMPVDDLLSATRSHGPVVVVNVSGLRCDALLLADGELDTLPLALEFADVVERARAFRAAIARTGDARLPDDLRAEADEVIDETLRWLWTAVVEPVLAKLKPAAGTRMWWVPTGPLTTLPLHAAGSALDRVVSSYAPTVRSLVNAWHTRPTTSAATSLFVAVPNAPGVPALPNVHAEAEVLARHFPNGRTVTGAEAVRRTVLDLLPHHSWAHFACHAISAADGTADGHLVLHDHGETPLTVADIARLRLTDAHLAYLSACDTGIPHEDLADEALHVAGACHMAGFRHVIGTLWAVKDGIAPALADDFYAGLATPPAVALHNAVLHLRATHPDSPRLWAPYVHIGP
jgi:CHAT domain-containing protein